MLLYLLVNANKSLDFYLPKKLKDICLSENLRNIDAIFTDLEVMRVNSDLYRNFYRMINLIYISFLSQ